MDKFIVFATIFFQGEVKQLEYKAIDFSSKKEDREYSKISVWAESQPDRNRTSVDARRSQDKRFGKALQWIRDKGRKQMDAPADED